MAEIIDFESQTMLDNISRKEIIKQLLQHLLKDSDQFQSIIVMINTNSNEKFMFHSDVPLEDKCVFIQLLQNEIQNELSPGEDVDFEEDF